MHTALLTSNTKKKNIDSKYFLFLPRVCWPDITIFTGLMLDGRECRLAFLELSLCQPVGIFRTQYLTQLLQGLQLLLRHNWTALSRAEGLEV